jgi:hypothetical protein
LCSHKKTIDSFPRVQALFSALGEALSLQVTEKQRNNASQLRLIRMDAITMVHPGTDDGSILVTYVPEPGTREWSYAVRETFDAVTQHLPPHFVSLTLTQRKGATMPVRINTAHIVSIAACTPSSRAELVFGGETQRSRAVQESFAHVAALLARHGRVAVPGSAPASLATAAP